MDDWSTVRRGLRICPCGCGDKTVLGDEADQALSRLKAEHERLREVEARARRARKALEWLQQ